MPFSKYNELLTYIWETGVKLDLDDVCSRIENVIDVDDCVTYFYGDGILGSLLKAARSVQNFAHHLKFNGFLPLIRRFIDVISNILRDRNFYDDAVFIRTLFMFHQASLIMINGNPYVKEELRHVNPLWDAEWNSIKMFLNFKDDRYKQDILTIAKNSYAYGEIIANRNEQFFISLHEFQNYFDKLMTMKSQIMDAVPTSHLQELHQYHESFILPNFKFTGVYWYRDIVHNAPSITRDNLMNLITIVLADLFQMIPLPSSAQSSVLTPQSSVLIPQSSDLTFRSSPVIKLDKSVLRLPRASSVIRPIAKKAEANICGPIAAGIRTKPLEIGTTSVINMIPLPSSAQSSVLIPQSSDLTFRSSPVIKLDESVLRLPRASSVIRPIAKKAEANICGPIAAGIRTKPLEIGTTSVINEEDPTLVEKENLSHSKSKCKNLVKKKYEVIELNGETWEINFSYIDKLLVKGKSSGNDGIFEIFMKKKLQQLESENSEQLNRDVSCLDNLSNKLKHMVEQLENKLNIIRGNRAQSRTEENVLNSAQSRTSRTEDMVHEDHSMTEDNEVNKEQSNVENSANKPETENYALIIASPQKSSSNLVQESSSSQRVSYDVKLRGKSFSISSDRSMPELSCYGSTDEDIAQNINENLLPLPELSPQRKPVVIHNIPLSVSNPQENIYAIKCGNRDVEKEQPNLSNVEGKLLDPSMVGNEPPNLSGQSEPLNLSGQSESLNLSGQSEPLNLSGQSESLNLSGQSEPPILSSEADKFVHVYGSPFVAISPITKAIEKYPSIRVRKRSFEDENPNPREAGVEQGSSSTSILKRLLESVDTFKTRNLSRNYGFDEEDTLPEPTFSRKRDGSFKDKNKKRVSTGSEKQMEMIEINLGEESEDSNEEFYTPESTQGPIGAGSTQEQTENIGLNTSNVRSPPLKRWKGGADQPKKEF